MCSRGQDRRVQQTFRFELDPNRQQRVLLAKSVGASRYVYNWGLSESQHQYKLTGTRPSLGELKSQLVRLKKGECPWLYEVSAHISQQALVDLDRAFVRFFKGLKGEGPRAANWPTRASSTAQAWSSSIASARRRSSAPAAA